MKAKLNIEKILDRVPTEEELLDMPTLEAVYVIRILVAALRSQHFNQTIILNDEPNDIGQYYSEMYRMWFSADEIVKWE